MKIDVLARARDVLKIEAQALEDVKNRLDENFVKAVEMIENCQGKVIVTGIGKSGHIARKIASTMSSTGTPALFVHPAESSHGDLGVIGTHDVVIAISYSGESPELKSILTYLTRKKIPLIAMTGSLQSSLSNVAAVTLDISVNKEACPLDLAPTASSTATLAMGDALAMAVMESKGFSVEQFAENHPGGKLGFKLSRVKENMHTGNGFVLCTKDTPLRMVFSLMSQKETRGGAGIVDEKGDLIGIITDGDIRRCLEHAEKPLDGVAADMMTKNPRTVDANEISEKALFMMEQYRINLLFVLDSQSENHLKPVGVIHIHDLLLNKSKV